MSIRSPHALAPLCLLTLLPFAACDDGSSPEPQVDAQITDAEMADADISDADIGNAEPSDAEPSGAEPSNGCWTDLQPGEYEVFYDGFPTGLDGGSEGVAFGADGRLYVGSGDTLWAFGPEGEPEAFAMVPNILGFARLGDGFVVASIGESNGDETDGAIYHVSAEGVVTLWADGLVNPNFVTMLPGGDALVSDAQSESILRVTSEGVITTAAEGIPSPNGMAYSPDGDFLYVASTFTPEGQVTRMPVGEDGAPLADGWVEVAALGSGYTLDGLAVSPSGAVYVAANIRHSIWRLTPTPDDAPYTAELFAEGLRNPASLAFGAGEGFDPCSVYVTQLFGSAVYRLAIGE